MFCFTGNTDILEEIKQNLDFSYVRILRLMYAKDDQVSSHLGLQIYGTSML